MSKRQRFSRAYLAALCAFIRKPSLPYSCLCLPSSPGPQLGATQCGSLSKAGKPSAAGMVKAGLNFSVGSMLALWLTKTCLFSLCCVLGLFMSFCSRGPGCVLVPACLKWVCKHALCYGPCFTATSGGAWRQSGLPSYSCGSQQNLPWPMLWHCVCGYGQIPPPKWGGLVCSPYNEQPRG